MSMLKFFRFPFAIAGDKTPIPDPSQVTGAVSYSTGFGPDYELDPLVNPDGKDVPRDETNALFFDVTNAIREYQTFGTPDYITSAMNGGVPFAYDRNARVVWTDGNVYESRISSNTDLPTVTASWRRVSGANDQTLLIAVAGGTANALTASFSPSLTTLTNGVPFFIRCAAPNTSATPSLNVDGLGAKTICKGANVALVAGDIPGTGFWAILQYDVTLDKFVLANPAIPFNRFLLFATAEIGDGGTLRRGQNVSAITRLSVGRYRVSFATVLPTSDYSVCGSASIQSTSVPCLIVCVATDASGFIEKTASSCVVDFYDNTSDSRFDPFYASVMVA